MDEVSVESEARPNDKVCLECGREYHYLTTSLCVCGGELIERDTDNEEQNRKVERLKAGLNL